MANDTPFGGGEAHYAAARFGPFKCATCEHVEFPHFCRHPDVVRDAKNHAPGLKLAGQKAVIELSGCCNYWRPR